MNRIATDNVCVTNDTDLLESPASIKPDLRKVSAQMRVLVIDDEPEMLGMLRDTLLPAGFEVTLTESARRGSQLYRAERIDLVILDLFMPDKDGLETLMEIRHCAPGARVLAISGGGGLGLGQALVWAKRMGASGVLAKPFTPRELLLIINKLLSETE